MNQTQIIGAIMLVTGKTVDVVAAKHGYSKSAFYRTINGTTKAQKTRNLISSIIKTPVNEIWPELAEEKGNKKSRPLGVVRAL